MATITSDNNYSRDEILRYAIDSGKIDVDAIQSEMDMEEHQKYLKKHPYRVWKGSDGYYKTYLPDQEKGRVLKKKQSKEELESLIIAYWKQQNEQYSVEDVFNEWNDRRLELEQIQPSTHHRNQVCFNRHFSEFGKRNIKTITPEAVEDFLEEQIAECHLTAKGFSNLKTIVRGFLKRAKKRKLISFNVEQMFMELDLSDSCFKQTNKDDSKEVFKINEFETLIAYLTNHRDIWNLGLLLLCVTGLRVGELCTLKWPDVKDDHYIHINRTETKLYVNNKPVYEVKEFPKTKAGIRTVVVPKDYKWIFKELRKINPFGEFIFMRKDKRMLGSAFRDRLYNVCVKLGIDKKSPHKIRKTYASILLNHGVDESLAISQLGHSDITCTENFYHKDLRSDSEKAAIIDEIDEFQVAK